MFDDARLDDPEVLRFVDGVLRHLAEAGSRIRREVRESSEQVESLTGSGPPRAVVVAGRDARLARAVLEPTCPVPFVAWTGPGLPGWVGALDLVVVLAQGTDESATSTISESVRRGCTLVVACPSGSAAARIGAGRYSTLLPTAGGDPLAGTVVLLGAMHTMGLAPLTDAEEVSAAFDQVAVDCSPYRDLATNPAKELALAIGDGTPLLWGGSVLAARAARRVAERIRRATGRVALAGEAGDLLPMIEATRPRDMFADPYEDGAPVTRSCLLILDDGAQEEVTAEQRLRLTDACEQTDVRVDLMTADHGSEVARYGSLTQLGAYAAAYLGVALVPDEGR